MKAWTCTEFEGHYPVGSAAVVVAEDEYTALMILVNRLVDAGLTGKKYKNEELTVADLKPLPLHGGRVVRILVDGNY